MSKNRGSALLKNLANGLLKRSAIPVTRNLAITYRHGENKHLVNGDCIKLSPYQNQEVIVDSYVVLIDDSLDLIVLQSKSAEFCDRDLIFEAAEPSRGMPYILMGFSVVHGRTSHISFSAGMISSDITSRLRFLGSSGAFKGDSGGSCWSDDGRLIGMQVRPGSDGRCEIIPITKIHAVILKFLPPEEDVEWNE
uniref:Trypsin family protein n=1 Tax=Panagrellus redivivus TaxID=6233 RepID=A0A7E4UTS2_PANRE